MVGYGLEWVFLTSFLLGIVGATAVCVTSALLARFRFAGILRYCGKHSIVIYLTFVFPLLAMEQILLPAIGAPFGSVGLACALTLALSVGLPLAFHAVIRDTPLRLLYERPDWARLSGSRPAPTHAALSG